MRNEDWTETNNGHIFTANNKVAWRGVAWCAASSGQLLKQHIKSLNSFNIKENIVHRVFHTVDCTYYIHKECHVKVILQGHRDTTKDKQNMTGMPVNTQLKYYAFKL